MNDRTVYEYMLVFPQNIVPLKLVAIYQSGFCDYLVD